jgi:hypothetical protein
MRDELLTLLRETKPDWMQEGQYVANDELQDSSPIDWGSQVTVEEPPPLAYSEETALPEIPDEDVITHNAGNNPSMSDDDMIQALSDAGYDVSAALAQLQQD